MIPKKIAEHIIQLSKHEIGGELPYLIYINKLKTIQLLPLNN